MRRFLIAGCVVVFGVFSATVVAQITVPTTTTQPVATLEDQLINRLRATTDDRKAFVRAVLARVEQGQLSRSLVLAVNRYAIRRNSQFPFPFFERAIRFEASKRGVILPSARTFIGPGSPSAS